MNQERLQLPDITLVCVDCVDVNRALHAMWHCQNLCDFGDAVLYTSLPAQSSEAVRVSAIQPLRNKQEVCVWMMKHLADEVKTSHLLNVQADGFVVNPDGWTPKFLECDYLGAPWPHGMFAWSKHAALQGNGGFSLRTAKLQRFLSRLTLPAKCHEDLGISVVFRDRICAAGFVFGSLDLAASFSVESGPYNGQFGFHGRQVMMELADHYWFPGTAKSMNIANLPGQDRRSQERIKRFVFVG